MMSRSILLCFMMQAAVSVAGNWYDGIDSVHVFSPGDDVQKFSWNLYNGNTESNQFSDKRHAILLKTGTYPGAQIAVGYYTSVMGVGRGPEDVTVQSFFSNDNPLVGNACDNFWRHAEGMTTTGDSITWATSQSAPLRRVHIQSELWLSQGNAPHWSSGGLLCDATVDGVLQMGTQQQYLVRNSNLKKSASGASQNYVYLGVDGAPSSDSAGSGQISVVDKTPRAASKPYLMENNGDWSIMVPKMQYNVSGVLDLDSDTISFEDVFIAKEGDDADTINKGIADKKALLLTPGIYGLDKPISINTPGFVVLGIGFPTLVATSGKAAVEVTADNVKLALVLLEAGTPVTYSSTDPLLVWSGNDGVGSDIFSRVGAFNYSRHFKPSCLKTRADIHVQVTGKGNTMENTWLWHADHDDCSPADGSYVASDQSNSQHGLVATGDDLIVYGLKAEHQFNDIVQWSGEKGQVYLFQSELPYDYSYDPHVAYSVAMGVTEHKGVGIGIYMIATNYTVDTGARVPKTADMTNVFVWSIVGSVSQFRSVVCNSPVGMDSCFDGDVCNGKSCYVLKLPKSNKPDTVIV